MQQFSRDWGGNWDFSTFLWNRTCATGWFCSSWLHKMVIWAMCFQAPVRQNQQCLLLSVTPWKRSLIPGSWILQSESGFRLSHCFAYCGILILSRKITQMYRNALRTLYSKQMNSSVAAEALQHGWCARLICSWTHPQCLLHWGYVIQPKRISGRFQTLYAFHAELKLRAPVVLFLMGWKLPVRLDDRRVGTFNGFRGRIAWGGYLWQLWWSPEHPSHPSAEEDKSTFYRSVTDSARPLATIGATGSAFRIKGIDWSDCLELLDALQSLGSL